MRPFPILLVSLWCIPEYGVCGVCTDGVSLSETEGETVTLNTGVIINQQDKVSWFYYDTLIAEITGDLSKICMDQGKKSHRRFRDRLKVNNQTGSLTITATRTTDSGVYKLKIWRNSIESKTIFIVTVHGFFSNNKDAESAFVMQEDSVTLNTDVKTDQQDKMRWYFNDDRIAEITVNQSQICTDDECKERFRDRLKVDHQTGSLTITNVSTEDTGVYRLRISNSTSVGETIFIIAVHDFTDKMTRRNKGNVTLHTCAVKKQHDKMVWYFKNTLITEMTGDQIQICTDDQCHERFRDRLKVDPQTGSLTITDTRITDSGEYRLQINSSKISIIKNLIITVTAVSPADPSSIVVPGMWVALVVVAIIAGFTLWRYSRRSKNCRNGIERQHNHDEDISGRHSYKSSNLHLLQIAHNGTSQ